MKKLLVAFVLALVPLTVSPALAYSKPSSIQASAAAADNPTCIVIWRVWVCW
jgi:hypothetical protein